MGGSTGFSSVLNTCEKPGVHSHHWLLLSWAGFGAKCTDSYTLLCQVWLRKSNCSESFESERSLKLSTMVKSLRTLPLPVNGSEYQ